MSRLEPGSGAAGEGPRRRAAAVAVASWARGLVVASVIAAAAGVPRFLPGDEPRQGLPGAVETLVSAGDLPDLGWPDRGDDRSEVRRFYEGRGFAPAWVRDGLPSAQARVVIGVLGQAAAKGLAPADYGVGGWRERVAGLANGAAEDVARFDVALTASLLRYVEDLAHGRVDPRCLGIRIDPGAARDPADGAGLIARLASAPDPRSLLAGLEPQSGGYRRLALALPRQRELARADPDLAGRVTKIELALERWRWTPERSVRPRVEVNLPEFRLRALDDTDRPAFATDVVIGEACRHETPIFSAAIEAVVFRPAWYVPTSIARGEIVPAAARDPGYLARKGYQVVGREGEEPTPELLAAVARGTLRLRQRPGPGNALGLVKLAVSSPYDVHLHDTPATALFERPRRDFSHGCIRLADPAGLAAWALRDMPGWGPERIRQAMHGTRDELSVPLDPPLPLHVVYETAVAPEEGEVLFFDDLYGRDARLAEALARGRPYPRLGACGAGSG